MSSSPDIVIIDSGGANIASLRFALDRLGCEAELTRDAGRIADADGVLLPGVGAAGDAMARLDDLGLADTIRGLTRPVMGICLGMQLLFDASEEDGGQACLGLLPGTARRMEPTTDRPVPHMGWNRAWSRGPSRLLDGVDDGAHFYFVHSYALPVADETSGTAHYGLDFTAVAERGHVVGTQFHPERSGAAGSRVLGNFIAMSAEGR